MYIYVCMYVNHIMINNVSYLDFPYTLSYAILITISKHRIMILIDEALGSDKGTKSVS